MVHMQPLGNALQRPNQEVKRYLLLLSLFLLSKQMPLTLFSLAKQQTSFSYKFMDP